MQDQSKLPTKETHDEHCSCGAKCHFPSKDLLPMIELPTFTRGDQRYMGYVTPMRCKNGESEFVICRFVLKLLTAAEYLKYMANLGQTSSSIPYCEKYRITLHQRKSVPLAPFFPAYGKDTKIVSFTNVECIEKDDGTLIDVKTGKPLEHIKDDRITKALEKESIMSILRDSCLPDKEWKLSESGDFMYIVTEDIIQLLYHRDTKPDFGLKMIDSDIHNMFLHHSD